MAESEDATAPDAVAPTGARDPYDVLRNRDFVLYLIGRFVAAFGQQMLETAVGWQIFKLTGEPISRALWVLTQMLRCTGTHASGRTHRR